jgi:hypothetical protein
LKRSGDEKRGYSEEKKENLCQEEILGKKGQTCRKAATQSYGSKWSKDHMIAEPPKPIVE